MITAGCAITLFSVFFNQYSLIEILKGPNAEIVQGTTIHSQLIAGHGDEETWTGLRYDSIQHQIRFDREEQVIIKAYTEPQDRNENSYEEIHDFEFTFDPADVNCDGQVNFIDFSQFTQAYNQNDMDYNEDGTTNVFDLHSFLFEFTY
jgi:hypothetical protein